MNPLHIAFEGPDGAGKTTLMMMVDRLLIGADCLTEFMIEPARKWRALLNKEPGLSDEQKLHAYLGSMLENQFVLEIGEGNIDYYLTDRSIISTLVYQGLHGPFDVIDIVRCAKIFNIKYPDVIVLCSVDYGQVGDDPGAFGREQDFKKRLNGFREILHGFYGSGGGSQLEIGPGTIEDNAAKVVEFITKVER